MSDIHYTNSDESMRAMDYFICFCSHPVINTVITVAKYFSRKNSYQWNAEHYEASMNEPHLVSLPAMP